MPSIKRDVAWPKLNLDMRCRKSRDAINVILWIERKVWRHVTTVATFLGHNAWKTLFVGIVDKHATLKTKRISKKHSLWITCDLIRKTYKRNYFKKWTFPLLAIFQRFPKQRACSQAKHKLNTTSDGGSLLAEVSHDEAKMRERRETSASREDGGR